MRTKITTMCEGRQADREIISAAGSAGKVLRTSNGSAMRAVVSTTSLTGRLREPGGADADAKAPKKTASLTTLLPARQELANNVDARTPTRKMAKTVSTTAKSSTASHQRKARVDAFRGKRVAEIDCQANNFDMNVNKSSKL